MFNGFILGRTKEIWEMERWPDLLRTEQRWWESFFVYGGDNGNDKGDKVFLTEDGKYYVCTADSETSVPDGENDPTAWWPIDTTYSPETWEQGISIAAGDVYQGPEDENAYVCILAHTSTTGRRPGNSTTYWQQLPFLQRIVEFEETGETAIGDVLGVYKFHPARYGKTVCVTFQIVDTGVEILEDLSSAFIHFRIQSPDSLSASDTTTIPYEFWQFIAYGAAADMELADGRAANAEVLNARAEKAKIGALDKLYRQQSQVPQTKVVRG